MIAPVHHKQSSRGEGDEAPALVPAGGSDSDEDEDEDEDKEDEHDKDVNARVDVRTNCMVRIP